MSIKKSLLQIRIFFYGALHCVLSKETVIRSMLICPGSSLPSNLCALPWSLNKTTLYCKIYKFGNYDLHKINSWGISPINLIIVSFLPCLFKDKDFLNKQEIIFHSMRPNKSSVLFMGILPVFYFGKKEYGVFDLLELQSNWANNSCIQIM